MTGSPCPGNETGASALLGSLHLPPARALGALALGLAGLVSALVWAPNAIVPSAILAFALSWATLVDIDRQILPDAITLGLILVGVGLALTEPWAEVLARSAGAMLGYGALFLVAAAFKKLRGREGLGLGDAKLFGAAGAWLGWSVLPYILLTSAALGLLWTLTGSLIGREPLNRRIAFGPFIAAGFWLAWLATKGGTSNPLFAG